VFSSFPRARQNIYKNICNNNDSGSTLTGNEYRPLEELNIRTATDPRFLMFLNATTATRRYFYYFFLRTVYLLLLQMKKMRPDYVIGFYKQIKNAVSRNVLLRHIHISTVPPRA
jgi:hypothetical protein